MSGTICSDNKASIVQLLQDIQKGTNTVRIVINSGLGAGNQKAPFTLMRKLRELGFQGRFDVCYHEMFNDSIENIELFVPGFHPSTSHNKLVHHPELGDMYFRKLRYADMAHDLPYVELAISAADPGFGEKKFLSPKPLIYHCANYIKLAPSGLKSSKNVACFLVDKKISISDESRLKATYVDRFDQTLIHDTQLATLLEAIRTAQRQNTIKFELIYGLFNSHSHWMPPAEELLRIARASLHASLDIPLVMVVPYNSSIIKDRTQLSIVCDFYDESNFYLLTQRLNSGALPKKSIALLLTGKLPEACFETLATESFFTVNEGANLEELMEATAHPHVHGGRKLTKILQPPASASAELAALYAIQNQANDYLEHRDSVEFAALVAWIQALATKDPKFIRYLEARHEVYLAKADMIEEALSIIAQNNTDYSQEKFIQQLLVELTKTMDAKECACLHTFETVPLARLKLLQQEAHLSAKLQPIYYDMVKRLITKVGQIFLEPQKIPSNMSALASFFSITPPSADKILAEKKRAFETMKHTFFSEYVADDSIRTTLSKEVMATLEPALTATLQNPKDIEQPIDDILQRLSPPIVRADWGTRATSLAQTDSEEMAPSCLKAYLRNRR